MKVFLYSFEAGILSLNVTNDNIPHVYAGVTYEASAIECKEFSFDLKEIMGEASISIPWTQCGFLSQFTQFPIEAPVEVTAYRYDTILASADLIFRGFVNTFKVSKAMVELQCVSFVENARDNYSRLCLTRHCNLTLYSSMCGVNPYDWRHNLALSTVSFFRTQVVVEKPSGYTDGYFTYGYIECGGAYRWITSDYESDGKVVIDLLHPAPAAWTSGIYAWVYAGCDKTIETCRSKFNNFEHFLGFPYAPYESIRFTGLKQQEMFTSSKK